MSLEYIAQPGAATVIPIQSIGDYDRKGSTNDTASKVSKLIGRRHPEYFKHFDQWRFFGSTYEGGRQWFDDNIFKYYREGPTEYTERVERCYRFNHSKEVVDLLNKYLFKQNIIRSEDAPKSVQEFWRRWHISLSTWFKEYLYIPLGGNRKGKYFTYLNLLIVFFATGLWHGASFNFILWGLWHGFFLIIERVFLGRLLEKNKLKFLNNIYVILVFVSAALIKISFNIPSLSTQFILIEVTYVLFGFSLFFQLIFINLSSGTVSKEGQSIL